MTHESSITKGETNPDVETVIRDTLDWFDNNTEDIPDASHPKRTPEELEAAWRAARPLREYFKNGGKLNALRCIDSKMAAYGDWHLYVDADGNFWEYYFSIGD